MGIKNISAMSSNSSSQLIQEAVDYINHDNVSEFMRAERLLETQYKTDQNDSKDDDNTKPKLFLQVTDIIEFKTDSFNHWGIYIGCDAVAHLTGGHIRQDFLADVADGRLCRINNKLERARQLNLTPLDNKTVIKRIFCQLDKPVESTESVFTSEHQVTLWKYDKAFSDTLDTIKDGAQIIGSVVGGVTGLATGGVVGAVGGAVAGYETGHQISTYVAQAVQSKD